MRRLFSTFAQGWPGAGLLILRLVAAGVAVACGLHVLLATESEPGVLGIAAIIAGALLSIGLWTPVSGCVVAGFALWALISKSGDPWSGEYFIGGGRCRPFHDWTRGVVTGRSSVWVERILTFGNTREVVFNTRWSLGPTSCMRRMFLPTAN